MCKWRACTYSSMHAPAGATVLAGGRTAGWAAEPPLLKWQWAPGRPCPARTPPIPGYGGVGQWPPAIAVSSLPGRFRLGVIPGGSARGPRVQLRL